MVERPVAVVHGALETNLLGAGRLARALIPLLVTFTVTQPGARAFFEEMADETRLEAIAATPVRTAPSGQVHTWDVVVRDTQTSEQITVEADITDGAARIVEDQVGSVEEYVRAYVEAQASDLEAGTSPLRRLAATAPVQVFPP